MNYKISLTDIVKREALIQRSLESSQRFEDFYDFRNSHESLKIIRLPIDILVYRIENFRTFSEQSEYINREGKSQDYFKSGQENESVQQVQHEILAKLAAKGKAASVVPIIDVLAVKKQEQNLLITQRGIVVNGNRRLAAMRELYSSDSTTYAHFSHVNCAVLPSDATPEDILEIEAVLQAQPETRLDYDWVGDAKLLGDLLLKHKGKVDSIAKRLNRKIPEVKNALQALNEADLYLKDWAKAVGQYNKVSENGEQFFRDLANELQGKSLSLQEASRAIAWTLFDNGSKLSGRLYNYNVAFGKRAAEVLDKLSENLGISLSAPKEGEDSDISFDMVGNEEEITYQPLIQALKNDEKKDDVAEELINICTSIIESEKDKKSGNAALKAISLANAKLAEVDISRASKDTYRSLDSQLSSIIVRATQIQKNIQKILQDLKETDSRDPI